MAKVKNRTNLPAPAVSSGKGPFEIIEAPPGFGGRASRPSYSGPPTIVVPLGDSKEEMAVRVHEYAHLELHREAPTLEPVVQDYLNKGLEPRWLDAGMDVVVNSLADSRNCKEVRDLPLDDLHPGTGEEVQAMWALRKMSINGGRMPNVGKAFTLDKVARGWVQDAFSFLQALGQKPMFYGTEKKLPIFMDKLLGLQQFFAARKVIEAAKESRTGLERLATEVLSGLDGSYGEAVRKETLTALLGMLAGKDATNFWGPMTIKVAAFDRTAMRKSPERRASFMGGFRSAFRLLLPAFDGRAWAIKRKLFGGTILIDVSGSMGIRAEWIAEILQYAPMAQIAMYSSQTNTCDSGVLWVLARKRRYTSQFPEHGGGNVVDGPALRWLCAQPKPRVWISDGGVTGVSDRPAGNLTAEALHIVLAGKVNQFSSIQSYMDFIRTGSRSE